MVWMSSLKEIGCFLGYVQLRNKGNFKKRNWSMLISQIVVFDGTIQDIMAQNKRTSMEFLWTKSVGSSSQIKS